MGVIPVWGIVIFVSLIPLIRLIGSFRTASEIPADADPQTAKVEVLFTVLFLIAFGMQLIVPIHLG